MSSPYKQIKSYYREKGNSEIYPLLKKIHKQRLYSWKNDLSVSRIERPTNLVTARRMGWKPIQGLLLCRVRVRKGSFRKRQIRAGRRPKNKGISRITVDISSRTIAEQRASRKFRNTEILNSYYVGATGTHKYFEVIMIEKINNRLVDTTYEEIAYKSGRVWRGLTSSKKKTHR